MGMQMTINEAAAALDVSTNTIRRRLTNRLLTGEKNTAGKWLIEIESPGKTQQSPNNGDFEALRELVDVLKAQVNSKDGQIRELHILLQQTQPQLQAPKQHHRWWSFWTK